MPQDPLLQLLHPLQGAVVVDTQALLLASLRPESVIETLGPQAPQLQLLLGEAADRVAAPSLLAPWLGPEHVSEFAEQVGGEPVEPVEQGVPVDLGQEADLACLRRSYLGLECECHPSEEEVGLADSRRPAPRVQA